MTLTPKDYLTVLTFVALLIGLAAGVVSQIAKTSDNVEGSNIKRLTTAGKLALGISLLGFCGSLSSELLKVYIADAQRRADDIEADRKKEQQRIENEWRQRSEQLLNAAVSKADENLRHVIEGFKQEQNDFLRQRLDAAAQQQELLNDNLIRETRLYGRLSAASTPLTKLTIRLVVDSVPADIRARLQSGIEAAKQRPKQADFQDLLEHHNADDGDERALVRSEMDQRAVQPFITWLATGKFEMKQSMLLIGLDDHFSAIACVGWIKSPDLFDPVYHHEEKKPAGKKGKDAAPKGKDAAPKKVTKLPAGIVIGKEIEWGLSYEPDTRDYARARSARPASTIEVSGETVILALDFDHLALSDALLRYAPTSMTTASLPDRVIFAAWSASSTGDPDSAFPLVELPFSSAAIGESLIGLNATKVAPGKRPNWGSGVRLEIVPNRVGEIAKKYDFAAVAGDDLMEGSRGDESHGYARLWRGQAQ